MRWGATAGLQVWHSLQRGLERRELRRRLQSFQKSFLLIHKKSNFAVMAPQLSELLKLSLPERILWAEALWNSIASDNNAYNAIHLTDEQLNHLDKIAAEFEANPAIGSSCADKPRRSFFTSSLRFAADKFIV